LSAETDDAFKLANPTAVTPAYQTTYRIFRVELMYPVKYNIERGVAVAIKDYYTTLYKPTGESIRSQRTVYIRKNWGGRSADDQHFILERDTVLRFNYGSSNPIYRQYLEKEYSELNDFVEDDIQNEETNIVESVDANVLTAVVGGTSIEYYRVTLVNNVRYEFAHGISVVAMYSPMDTGRTSVSTNNMIQSVEPLTSNTGTLLSPQRVSNVNHVLTSGLATQNILVNGEWYTRIFYQSERNLDILGVNVGGVKGISENSRRQVYIYGMRGCVLPNLGFQSLERMYLNSPDISLEDYQKNTYIKPVPDGLYDVLNIVKEDNMSILDGSYLPIAGTFIPLYTVRGADQPDEWIDNYTNYRWFYVIVRDNTNPLTAFTAGEELYQYNHYPIPLELSTVSATINNEFILTFPRKSDETSINTTYQIRLSGGYGTSVTAFMSDLNNALSSNTFRYWNGSVYVEFKVVAEYASFYNMVRIRFRNTADTADVTIPSVSLDLTTVNSAYRVLGYTTKEFIRLTNVSSISPTVYSSEHTRLDTVCLFHRMESTTSTYVYNGTSYAVYKATVRVDARALASGFLRPSVRSTSVRLSTEDDLNTYTTPASFITNLSNRVGSIELKPVYYQPDQNVASIADTSALEKTSYNSITIKGRYQGFGGSISLDTKSTIFNSIEYTVSDVDKATNTLELDLENNRGIYTTFYRMNQSGKNRSQYIYYPSYTKQPTASTQLNPAFSRFKEVDGLRSTFKRSNMEVIEQYDIYPNRYGFMATNGTIYKPKINRPYSTDTLDYIFMCIRNIPTDFVLEQNSQIGNHVVFAKIYINKSLNNYDLDITNYEVVYDISLLPSLDSVEVYYIDKVGNLLNFNNVDNNFVLEIQEYVERVKTINTKNAMVY